MIHQHDQWAASSGRATKRREKSRHYISTQQQLNEDWAKSPAEPLEQQQQQERGKSGSKWFTCGLISS
jgi:hypothetical protein